MNQAIKEQIQREMEEDPNGISKVSIDDFLDYMQDLIDETED